MALIITYDLKCRKTLLLWSRLCGFNLSSLGLYQISGMYWRKKILISHIDRRDIIINGNELSFFDSHKGLFDSITNKFSLRYSLVTHSIIECGNRITKGSKAHKVRSLTMVKDQTGVHECDVLVIGGGLAGIWAAIRAKELVDNVILVDKAKVSRSGCSTFAAGVMLYPTPGDDLKVWAQEMVESGEYLCDQEWVELLLTEQIERIKEMESWDMPFERYNKGALTRIIGRGHINTRMLMFHGKKLMEAMRKQVLKKGVKLVERTMVVDLLTSDGKHPTQSKVVGAVGFNPRTEEFHVFKAKATILATGPAAGKVGGGYVDNNTGDGTAMAFRVGAELIGMEFCIRGHQSFWARKYITYGINMIQGHGAKFINAKGERFMERYSPVLKERARNPELCIAFCKEALEGRGPLYCDMRHFPPETFERFRRVIPHTMRAFDAAGIDPSKQLIEYGPQWRIIPFSGEGGIRINIDCETTIPSLYSAGTGGWNPAQGTYSVGGTNLAFCCVSGFRAGERAAKYALQSGEVELQAHQVQALKEVMLTAMSRREGPKPDEIFEQVQRTITPAQYGVFKTEARIKEVLSNLQKTKEVASRLMAANYHELVKANEAVNFSLLCELVFESALVRKESRGFHFREEYPERDDIEWLKWVILKRGDEKLKVRLDPVPIDRYPFKPATFGKHPYPVPFFFKKE